MTAQAPELVAVVARLEKVERQNRRLRGAGIAVLVLAAAGLLMGQAMPKTRIVEAEEFVLRDAAGKVRAMLGATKDWEGLNLYDENDRVRVRLDLRKDGPGLTLYEENGKVRADLGAIKAGPRLILYDENGKPRAGLSVGLLGPGVYLAAEDGVPRVWLAAWKNIRPGLVLLDENGKTIWSTP
ncbi:MAG: hypothetical protein ACHQ7N_20145 [Candidatus Methylomirabilales bacterium]